MDAAENGYNDYWVKLRLRSTAFRLDLVRPCSSTQGSGGAVEVEGLKVSQVQSVKMRAPLNTID